MLLFAGFYFIARVPKILALQVDIHETIEQTIHNLCDIQR